FQDSVIKGLINMDISQDIHTQLLLKHGAVQTSPQHAAMLNTQPASSFVSVIDRTPAVAGYQVRLSGYAEHIRNQEFSTSYYPRLDDLLRSLRALPRSPDAKLLKGSVSTHMLEKIGRASCRERV